MRSNGIIPYDQVGESEEETLKCYTVVEGCCMQETAANWKYPDGSVVKHRVVKICFKLLRGDGDSSSQKEAS